MDKHNAYKRIIIAVLRIFIGIGLSFSLVYATLKWTGADLWRTITDANVPLLVFSVFFHGIIICMTSFRWRLLLNVQGVCLHIWSAVRYVLMGFFFSLALPGSVSGDLMKMSFVARHTKSRKAEAILTVMLDRVCGLFGLFIVASVTVVYSLPFLLNLGYEYRSVQIAAYLVGVGSIFGVFSVVLVEFYKPLLRIFWIARIIDCLAGKIPESILTKIVRLLKAIDLYKSNRWTIVSAIAISVMVHSCLAINLFIIGAAVGENVLGLREYFLASQVGNAVAALPLTPGGVGTRDAAIAMFFNAMQAPAKSIGVIPVIMTLIFVFWGVLGGIIFTYFRISKSVEQSAGQYR